MLAWAFPSMYCDYHTHTPLCLHASGTPQEYVQAAVRAGLREYGISDHAPMPGEPFDDWRMKQADMPAYLDWLTEARECWRRNRKGPAGPFRHQSNSEAILMITLSDSVLDDLRTFRGRNAARTIRIEKGSSG